MSKLTMQHDVITATEKETLLKNICTLLEEYDYNYDVNAIKSIINEWAYNKSELIAAFKKHPNYIDGKFMIAFSSDYERSFDKAAIRKFSRWISLIIPVCADNIPDAIKERKGDFVFLPNELYTFLTKLDMYITERTISDELTKLLDDIIPEIKPHAGEKSSRVINRICTHLGFNKHEDYNREYAKFADGLNPLVIKRHTVLSINPLDYLTMSFGNSWASCHTIDKNNKRHMPNNYSGCYSSGTISYMLDGSSMVLYTVDAKYEFDEYWTQPKINRQMFHWGQDKLVQGRLYPQDNDDDRDAYAPYRNIVQQIISYIFNFPNLWTLSRGTEAANKYIYSYGTHYRDYQHYPNCTLSKKSGSENEKGFGVGHEPICVECGNEHDTEDNINCCSSRLVCADCGRVISEDDAYWIGDDVYCDNCVRYCSHCGCYEHAVDATYIESEDIYVCDDCLNSYYTYCDECHEYLHNNNMTYIEHLDIYVCDGCLANNYTRCNECGEYYPDCEIHCEEDGRYLCNTCRNEEKEEGLNYV